MTFSARAPRRPAAGSGIGIAIVYRCVREAIDLLAALAPCHADAVRAASRLAFVILDGTLLPIGRSAADTPAAPANTNATA